MLEHVLTIRETTVKFFKQFEVFIMPLLKFLLGLFVFSSISGIGAMNESLLPFTEALTPTMLNMLFAILFTIMPMSMGWVLIILTVTINFSANMETLLAVFVVQLFVYLFYARMAPKESILIIFMLIAFRYNVPFLVPLVAGLYFSVTSVIPITLGVFINSQVDGLLRLSAPTPAVAAAADRELTEVLSELPAVFTDFYSTIMGNLTGDTTWIYSAIIFALVVVLVHFVSRQAIDYAKEIAIGLGAVMTIFGFIISVLFADGEIGIGMMIFGTVVCAALALLIRFFDSVLDYQRAEAVQFEDDNNYYHVRIVPKVILTKAQRSVKRIRPQDALPAPETLPPSPFEDPDDEYYDTDTNEE